MAATTADLVQEFIDLDLRRKNKEGEVDKLKDELKILEATLLTRFENAGVQSQKVNGVTVYVNKQLWAGALEGDTPRMVWALKEAGLGELVQEKFNSQSLSAWVREQAKEYVELAGHKIPMGPEDIIKILPKPLHGAISLSEKFSLRTRKG